MVIRFKNKPACEGTDTEMWFPNSSEYPNKHLLIKICNSCPASNQCLEYALEYEVDGWWANTTSQSRRKIRAERGIIAKPVLPLGLVNG